MYPYLQGQSQCHQGFDLYTVIESPSPLPKAVCSFWQAEVFPAEGGNTACAHECHDPGSQQIGLLNFLED